MIQPLITATVDSAMRTGMDITFTRHAHPGALLTVVIHDNKKPVGGLAVEPAALLLAVQAVTTEPPDQQ